MVFSNRFYRIFLSYLWWRC